MNKNLLLLFLACLLGNSALAQNRAIMKPVTETIDFTGLPAPDGNNQQPNANVVWNGNVISSISSNGQTLRTFSEHPISVGNRSYWRLWKGSNSITYLQKDNANNDNFYIANLKKGDIVTVWGDNGNDDNNGGFRVISNNNDRYNPNTTIRLEYDLGNAGQVITMNSDGTLQLLFTGRYSGVERITIQTVERETPHFDYDPGYEEYDMYDEFSENDPDKSYNNNGQLTSSSYHTSYTLSDEATGFTLNGNPAKYIILSGSKNTANNRIAIDPNAGDWRFNYGLRSPSGTWGTFSICNLREGDRVVFSYTGTAPKFSSAGENGSYMGSKAFFDKYNDGVYDEGEDVYIASGANPVTDWYRGEGNIYAEDHNGRYDDSPEVNPLRYTRYVITEDGHLDLAIAPNTRIVKIKIYSDHQASMVDEYDAEKYTAKFDITGELQAMEHIVPGGLEVHVGNNDASQHAHVVSSPHGPVSIVNGVNGYKLPGMSLGANGNLQFEFNLANNIPETGTFYKFMPLEDGKMTLTFQAASMNYYSYAIDGDEVYYGDNSSYGDNGWSKQYDRPNEQTRGVTCPYYLVKVDARENKTFTKIGDYFNGEEVTYQIPGNVKADETYYLYGGWNATDLFFRGSGQGNNNIEYLPYNPGNGGTDKACGVAKLLQVVFNPNKKIYPLAKWVPNGTTAVKDDKDGKNGVPNPDTFETEYELADLWGYNDKTSLTVKKMSGNITACHPYLHEVVKNQHYKLMIDGIQYGDGDKGGTILIKIGDARIKGNPVYALTIAYSTDPTYDGNSGTGTRGHIWDYSSNALNGLKYDQSNVHVESHIHPGNIPVYTHNAATPEPYGHYFADYFAADISNYSSNDEVLKALPKSGTGLLYEEISGGTSDWMFNYNLVNAGKLYDPLFTNKYDLEGDNADLIWNTEGMVLRTSANSSVMFNEFTGADIHQSTKDPERYVGILKGGEFRIPWLRPNDRVIIYMGTGKGAFNDHAVFNIRGAYDAEHKEISESDDYIVGGSHWDGEKGDKNYRGCYHFFAKGHNDGPADMVFKMTGGSMCKIYSIQIYRGDRIITNEIVGATTNDKFLLWSRAHDPNEPTSETNKDYTEENRPNWTLQYFGKDQKLADGSNDVKNDIISQTGNLTKAITTNATDNTFTYQHALGDIGTFRVRGKDMEKNMKYVADYADHNVTVAYQETQKYPYTWDFKDMTGFSDEALLAEDALEAAKPDGFTDDYWNSIKGTYYEITSNDLSLWETDSENGAYWLRLNSQSKNPKAKDNIFQTAKSIDGNQVWANGAVVPETRGLWFYTDNNVQTNGGKWIISDEGMQLNGYSGWPNSLVVPNVPKNAAVYLRMKNTVNTPHFAYSFKGDGGSEVYPSNGKPMLVPGTESEENEVNYAEYIFAIKNNGNTKRHLVLSFGGYELKKLAVSTDPKTLNVKGYASESRKRIIDHSLTEFFTGVPVKAYMVKDYDKAKHEIGLDEVKKPMPAATDNGDAVGTVLHKTNAVYEENNGEVKILDNQFHLFVPDMHDTGVQDCTDNLMLSFNAGGTGTAYLPATADGYTNFVLNWQYYRLDSNGNIVSGSTKYDYGEEAFFRIGKNANGGKGAAMKPNSAYIKISDSDVAGAKISFIFDDIDDIDDGTPTEIVDIESTNADSEVYHTLSGVRVHRPTGSGLYIKNGKKIYVK